jgi:succinylglutamate desuccinylase
MHGNEPAGVQALELVLKMLEVEPISNPDFKFKGRLLGLIGNLKAYREGVRFIDKDLNRSLIKEHIDSLCCAPGDALDSEDLEMKELIEIVRKEIAQYQPEQLVFLDLHTTSSFGGIFSLCNENEESLKVAFALHAPVVLGFTKGIRGTTMHYFNNENFQKNTISLSFESGQHQEKLSVNRAISAIINCLKEIGCINENHVENFHEEILIRYSDNLPKLTHLLVRHAISPGDHFEMQPGYVNFQKIQKGEHIATDINGPISAGADGLLLMPLYQKKGEDGFFIVKEIDSL